MSKAIVTFNVGNYWPANARYSVLDAAARWGAEVVEMTASDDISRDKFRIHRKINADRVLYLDADMLIRQDCPSPFDLVPENYFGAVSNYQDDERIDERLEMDGQAWSWLCQHLGRKDFSARETVNGWFLLWAPACHDRIIDQLDALLPDKIPMLAEQAAWGWAFRECLHLLPHGFNRVGRSVWESSHRMTSYVYHWANWFEYRGAENKRERIQRTGWMVPVEERAYLSGVA